MIRSRSGSAKAFNKALADSGLSSVASNESIKSD